MAFDETLAKRIRTILAARKDLVEKHMFGGVCFMIRGRMCCGIIDSSLMARLDPDLADRLADHPHVRPMDFTGKPMRGYLFVDPEGIDSPKALKAGLERSVAYVETLPVQKKSTAAKPRRTTKRR